MAALVATGVAQSGERRILGLELAAGNDEGSARPAFIRSLVERGLTGVRLVISDDHRGLVKAVLYSPTLDMPRRPDGLPERRAVARVRP